MFAWNEFVIALCVDVIAADAWVKSFVGALAAPSGTPRSAAMQEFLWTWRTLVGEARSDDEEDARLEVPMGAGELLNAVRRFDVEQFGGGWICCIVMVWV